MSGAEVTDVVCVRVQGRNEGKRRRSSGRDGVKEGHLVRCNAPVVFNFESHTTTTDADETTDARLLKRRCSEAAAKRAAVGVVAALLVAAAVLIALHLLRRGPEAAPPDTPRPVDTYAVVVPEVRQLPDNSSVVPEVRELPAAEGNDSCGSLGGLLGCGSAGDDTSGEGTCPRYYTPAQWGASPPNKVVPMVHPIRYVVVSHTAQSRCSTLASCARHLRSMQRYHLSGRYDDLAYSFLVADDGSVYEARGWHRASSHLGARGNTVLGVGFLGDYRRQALTAAQVNSTLSLLERGLECGYLDQNYQLVGHNQTRITESPGQLVYREIKTWPHYSDVRLFWQH